jgi:elongation factor Ts
MAITAAMVKTLRDRTSAGMMDCKNALEESGGDEDKAVEILQKKGLLKAAKKAGAIAADGVIHSYIHAGGRLGVLVEINCQTDFVARSPEFRSFADLVGLQIASMSPEFVRREDIPESAKANQLRFFTESLAEEEAASGKSRPEAARAKILEGKLDKWMAEKCLEEQSSVHDADDGKSIKDICDALSAKIGEKIAIRRFVRFELGEGIEKKKADLAAEVAEQLKSVG